ncbi:MAG: hypothetical protein WB992_10065 [Bryobacteraceae bacterium]
MARGWESKAVESQIEAAERRESESKAAQISAGEMKLQKERESIELSRTRVLQDLAAATNPKYCEQLQRSLKYLDEKLAALNEPPNKPDPLA